MGGWLYGAAGVVGAGAVSAALAVGVAARRWHAATEDLSGQLAGNANAPSETVAFAALESLPDPVQRYFRLVLRDGQPHIRSARIRQAGEFRSKETADTAAGWQPFEATQVFTARPPGFVWDARIRMAPLLNVWVRDGYVGGRASMLGGLMAVLPVVRASDSPMLRAGALQRYLAESVWLPTALLPGESVKWSAMDDSHARATLSDGEFLVALEFEFGANGEIVAVYSPGRERAAPDGRASVTLPWGGRYRDYQTHCGMRVPSESEVYWVVEGREQPYYRGRNIEVEYDFGQGYP